MIEDNEKSVMRRATRFIGARESSQKTLRQRIIHFWVLAPNGAGVVIKT